MIFCIEKLTDVEKNVETVETAETATDGSTDKKFIPMFVGIMLIMGMLYAVSFTMQRTYLGVSDQVNTAYARLFYAVGLIPAGLLADYSRNKAAIACLVTRGLSFLLILLFFTPMRGFEAAALSYLLSGFYTAYRTTASMDFAKETPSLFYFAVFGILFGRTGEMVVTIFYRNIQMDALAETLAASVFYVVLALMFFPFIRKLYGRATPEPAQPVPLTQPVPPALPVPPVPTVPPVPSVLTDPHNPAQTLSEMVAGYGITSREAAALQLLMQNKDTGEIAAAMFVTEGTVYKYISSMMAKTGTKNRLGLLSVFTRRFY